MHKVDDIEFSIVKKRRLKHTYIYVKEDGVEVRAPLFVSKMTLYKFVQSKREWIKKQQKKLANRPKYDHFDKEYLKQKAKQIVDPMVAKWASVMKVEPKSVGYRYNKSRWGSCSSQNRLNFNTKLATMPFDFIEYVVVHELSHIKHKNHSKLFWAEVEKFLPDYKERKRLIDLIN